MRSGRHGRGRRREWLGWWAVARFREAFTLRRKKALSAVLITAGVLAGGMIGPTP